MKDRRNKRSGASVSLSSCYSFFFWCALALLFFSSFTFRLFFREGFHSKLVSSLQTSATEAISGESLAVPAVSVRGTVLFPDQALVFLKYPPSTPLSTKVDINCLYFAPNVSHPQLKLSPLSVDDAYQTIRCPLPPRGLIASVSLRSHGDLTPGPTHDWNWLAYEALIDRDNTTVVFVKGLNLRPGRLSNGSRFRCVYGWDFSRRKFLLRSEVVSIAQEIVRCKTPLSILNGQQQQEFDSNSIKVSVRVIGRGILHSIARLEHRVLPSGTSPKKQHQMCICTMLRNQAQFLREWVIYHSRIGVERWFIYDNNSNDDIEKVVEFLLEGNFNVTRYMWPWIKTQEAGFSHCALRAWDSCEWVAFIDVDEFLHLPSGLSLDNVLNNQSRPSEVAELRTSCHSFGPSGLKRVPSKGVTVGYTCRLSGPERHKSIVRPEALNSTLINRVHHFHLRDGFKYTNMDRNVMVINHYKYQVWEVFKEKFYRRVATYVSDWQQKRNVGSKDRAPGLGTRAVEPADWPSQFCEVMDTGLRDQVLGAFIDQKTGLLPWQDGKNQQDEIQDVALVQQNRKPWRKRKEEGY